MSSDNLKDSLGERLKTARWTFALTQKEWCEKTGMKLSSLRSYELDNRVPGAEALSLYAREGINVNWLLTGDGTIRMGELALPNDRVFISIPSYVEESEDGSLEDINSEIASLALRRAWLNGRGVRMTDLSVHMMPDSSMSPTIQLHSLLVLDSSPRYQKSFGEDFGSRGDGIYGLVAAHGFLVRRLQQDLKGGVLVRCDNPTYKDLHIEDAKELTIIGKLIWAGGEFKD